MEKKDDDDYGGPGVIRDIGRRLVQLEEEIEALHQQVNDIIAREINWHGIEDENA